MITQTQPITNQTITNDQGFFLNQFSTVQIINSNNNDGPLKLDENTGLIDWDGSAVIIKADQIDVTDEQNFTIAQKINLNHIVMDKLNINCINDNSITLIKLQPNNDSIPKFIFSVNGQNPQWQQFLFSYITNASIGLNLMQNLTTYGANNQILKYNQSTQQLVWADEYSYTLPTNSTAIPKFLFSVNSSPCDYQQIVFNYITNSSTMLNACQNLTTLTNGYILSNDGTNLQWIANSGYTPPLYFSYSGNSKQYILNSDVQNNEIDVVKLKGNGSSGVQVLFSVNNNNQWQNLEFSDVSGQISMSQIANNSITLNKLVNNATATVQYLASVGSTNQFAEIQNQDVYINGTNNYLVYVQSNRLAFQQYIQNSQIDLYTISLNKLVNNTTTFPYFLRSQNSNNIYDFIYFTDIQQQINSSTQINDNSIPLNKLQNQTSNSLIISNNSGVISTHTPGLNKILISNASSQINSVGNSNVTSDTYIFLNKNNGVIGQIANTGSTSSIISFNNSSTAQAFSLVANSILGSTISGGLQNIISSATSSRLSLIYYTNNVPAVYNIPYNSGAGLGDIIPLINSTNTYSYFQKQNSFNTCSILFYNIQSNLSATTDIPTRSFVFVDNVPKVHSLQASSAGQILISNATSFQTLQFQSNGIDQYVKCDNTTTFTTAVVSRNLGLSTLNNPCGLDFQAGFSATASTRFYYCQDVDITYGGVGCMIACRAQGTLSTPAIVLRLFQGNNTSISNITNYSQLSNVGQSGSWNSVSSKKLKDEDCEFQYSEDSILKCLSNKIPRKFCYKSDSNKKQYFGLFLEDLQKCSHFKTCICQDGENNLLDQTGYNGVVFHSLIALSRKYQQQKEINKQQEQKIQQLELQIQKQQIEIMAIKKFLKIDI